MQVSASSLAAFAQDVLLPMGLVVDEVELKALGLSYDTTLSMGQPAQAKVRISAQSLQDFVVSQLPPIVQKLNIKFQDGKILATATVRLVLEVTATAHLLPQIVDGKTLMLKMVDFEGPGIARGLLEKQIEERNPIFDTSTLPFPLELQEVTIGEMLELSALVNTPTLQS